MITKERKQELISQFADKPDNAGSTEVQLALLTQRILEIAAHMKLFPKDKHSQVGLKRLVGQRHRLTRYLKRTNPSSYDKIVVKLKTITLS